MASENYPFQTGYRVHGRPQQAQSQSPTVPDPKKDGANPLDTYALSGSVLFFAGGVAAIILRMSGQHPLQGFDIEALVMTLIGGGFVSEALRRSDRKRICFGWLALWSIPRVFLLAVGSTMAMDMSQVALQQGMLATLTLSFIIILGGWLIHKFY